MPRPLGKGCDHVLERCLAVRAGEQVVLLTDDGTEEDVVTGLAGGIAHLGATPLVARIPVPALPGAEPPTSVAAMMREAGAVIELTSLFIGSSAARRRATEAGVRYLAMPCVRVDTFRDDGPLTVDFDAIRADAETVGAAWGAAERFRLTTPAGTAPVEGTAEGVVVIDADLLFMGVGPLPEPVVLHVRDGRMRGMEGAESVRLEEMLARCGDHERMRNIAEVSMAFNPAGRVCGVAMETESALGTAHIALGNSIAYGGTVDAVAHLDCVMKDATLELDGRPVMVAGELV